jgi:hypothetical protein
MPMWITLKNGRRFKWSRRMLLRGVPDIDAWNAVGERWQRRYGRTCGGRFKWWYCHQTVFTRRCKRVLPWAILLLGLAALI